AAINRNRVFVAGSSAPGSNPTARDLRVRAYDVSSGDVDWELSLTDLNPSQFELAAGRLFVAGTSSSSSLPYLAALSANAGAALWEDAPPHAGSFNDIAVKGS